MPEPILPQPQQGSWTDLILPFAIGAGSLASGFAAGRNPGVDNPGASFLQPLQTMSLLDYRTGLTQHYRDLAAYQQAEEQHKLAAEQRQVAEFDWKRTDAERQRRIAEANEQRKAYWNQQAQGWMGGGGMPQAPASPPSMQGGAPTGLPTPSPMGPGMLQPPQTSLPQTGGFAGMQYKPKMTISPEGPSMTLEEPPESVNRRLSQQISPSFPGTTPEQVYGILSGVAGKLPSDMDRASQYVNNSLSALGKYDQQSATYLNMRDAFHRMREVAANPNPLEPAAGDMSLMYSYVRLLDPNTGVKEGEYATIQNAPGLPERWRNLYNRVIQGGKLPPEFKSEMLAKSEQMYISALQNQARLEMQYKQQLGQIGQVFNMQSAPLTPPDFIGEDRQYLGRTRQRPTTAPSTLPPYPTGDKLEVQKPTNIIQYERDASGKLVPATR